MESMGAAGLPKSMNYKTCAISLFLGTIPFVGLWKGAPSLQVGRPTKGIDAAQAYLPHLSLDFTDLDARDAQNRPVQNDTAQSRLTSIFLENLFSLTVAEAPHDLREAWSMLEAFSLLFHKAILRTRLAVVQLVEALLKPSSRRVVHNVGNLWVTISVGVILAFWLTANDRLQKQPLKLNLRC
jgi:hypothetical protein